MTNDNLARVLIDRGETDIKALTDAYDLIRFIERDGAVDVADSKGNNLETVWIPENFSTAHELSKELRASAARSVKRDGGEDALDIYRRTLLFDAPYDFDCAMRFAEWNREPKKRFYEPRRKQLLPIVKELQRLADDELDLLAISTPPGVGKTTLGLMFVTWMGLRDPMRSMLIGSHSNAILRGMYDEINRYMEQAGEYLWRDVFPRVGLAGTNAKDLMVDFGVRKRFTTIEMTSLGASNSGRLRASNLLYCDDLIPGLETALSADRLDKVWQQYSVDLRQRKMGTAKELHIATRWSVHDVIGRLEEMYEGNDRAKFIKLPALNGRDESNFDYPYNLGFSTEFYHNQREVMDDVSWRCLFMNEPIEREGLLYDSDELRRYFELPSVEPDAVVAVCDTKNSGPDYCVMPIAYQYGQDFYIEQIICDNGTPDVVEPKLVSALLKHGVKLARFESNNAGGRVAESVQKAVREAGGTTHITTKWNQANKETRIIVDSSWVKGHCLFKDESLYDKEYRLAMKQLCGFTMSGKNKHDDTPDAFSMLADFAQGYASTKVQIVKRWF